MDYFKTLIVGFALLVIALIGLTTVSARQAKMIMDEVELTRQETEDLRAEIGSMTDAISAYEVENASLTDALEDVKDEIKSLQNVSEDVHNEPEEDVEDTEENILKDDTDKKEDVSQNDNNETIIADAYNTTESEVVFDELDTDVDEMIDFDSYTLYEDSTEAPTNNSPLSDTDIYYLQRVAETETYGADMMSKTHVVSVVLNRLNAGTWGSSVQAVVTSPSQFVYSRTSISQSTIDAVNYVLENGDTAQGAMYFHSGAYSSTFCGRSWIFTDDCGHHFY